MSKFRLSFTTNVRQLAEVGLILYFCYPVVRRILLTFFSFFGLTSLVTPITLCLVYLPVFLIFARYPRKIPVDFLVLWAGVVLFFAMTYLYHPEYAFWYTRKYYGVWDYVLRPENGIYAYLFIRLIDDPDQLSGGMKKASWIMYAFYMVQLLSALRRGYWIDTNAFGETVHKSYDLTYGYNVLLFMLCFLQSALRDKNKLDFGMAIVGAIMIFLGGSRGPIACVAVFFAVYYLYTLQEVSMVKKLVKLMVFICAAILVIFLYKYVLLYITLIMDRFGLSSRTLKFILEGNLADDNGRNRIWETAINMIKENPWGYGAFGTRHVIYYVIGVGHPHQILLELLVDFGVIVGSAIILLLLIGTMKIILSNYDFTWKMVFLAFFARACQLLLSGTFWHVAPFWACLGVGVSATLHEKRQRRRYDRINGI